ncbi:MAG: hypothetical protein PHO13_01985 [Fermentimonas sp.]|nr:hypothetical protein [Fermentimonas sp.]HBT85816.1 hypothetical protein [Porphyromonadaceae bacterium]MDD3188249.1 hypothetical protein [Fermentimonas sp.]MDD3511100.1 hypothetical protein [Fermentimonas sp.]MDD4283351.1 hypothetical protein [Fermentimonas sp.]
MNPEQDLILPKNEYRPIQKVQDESVKVNTQFPYDFQSNKLASDSENINLHASEEIEYIED